MLLYVNEPSKVNVSFFISGGINVRNRLLSVPNAKCPVAGIENNFCPIIKIGVVFFDCGQRPIIVVVQIFLIRKIILNILVRFLSIIIALFQSLFEGKLAASAMAIEIEKQLGFIDSSPFIDEKKHRRAISAYSSCFFGNFHDLVRQGKGTEGEKE